MYLPRDTQFLLNKEITCMMPFYLHHSRSWATSWYSSYHFPLKRAPTIFLYFDTSSINSPCFAPFALCLALFLQIRDKWTSNNSETNLTKEISNLPCNPLAFVGFFPVLIIFHRIFWIFLQDKTRKISHWETVILISNRTFLWKIVGNVLERCTKFFATPNNLPILL